MPRKRKPLGVIVCMPTRGIVTIETALCLREHLDGYSNKLFVELRKPVDVARNDLAKRVVELDVKSLPFEPKYVLWVDDDAWWPEGTLSRAIDLLEANPEADILGGVFTGRCVSDYYCACELDPVSSGIRNPSLLRYKMGHLIPVVIVGGHWQLMRRDLLLRIGDKPYTRLESSEPSDNLFLKRLGLQNKYTLPEDISFCIRAVQRGAKLFVERSLSIGHVDASSGRTFFPGQPARIANGLVAPRYDKSAPPFSNPKSRSHYASQSADVWKADIQDLVGGTTEQAPNAETETEVIAESA